MQARYYDPVMGRFLSIDPVTFMHTGTPAQFNRYAYTFNDPINMMDPDGENPVLNMGATIWRHGVSDQTKTNVHTALDVGGFAGPAGPFADAANTALYAAEGDIGNTLLSAVAAVPLAGDAVKGLVIGNKVRKAAKTCCFVAGTLVETEYGLRPIEDIQIGDLVWARDEDTGEEALKPVLGLIRLHDRVIWDLETISETGEVHTFGTTDDHPWWVDGHGWKRTDELSPKDILVTQTGGKVRILSVTNTKVVEPTFNFEVADFNTYFVGESKVWVHNANCFGERVFDAFGGGKKGKKRFHEAKKSIVGDFKNELKKTNVNNPDVGVNDAGNVIFRDPRSKKTILETDVPLESYVE